MRTALLIIDMFNTFAFVNGNELRESTKKIIRPILTLKDFAQKNDYPIIYINDRIYNQALSVPNFMRQFFQSKDREFISILKPNKTDHFIFKEKFSAFFLTELDTLLKEQQIHRLIFSGIAGHICVLFSVNDAYMRGYQIITPKDAYACGGKIQKLFTDEMFQNVFKSQTLSTSLLIQKLY